MTIYTVQLMAGRRLAESQAIIFEGETLLVVQWYANQAESLMRPEYVIPLATLQHQDLGDDPKAPARFFVNEPLPESLFDGSATRAEHKRFGVRKGPDVTYQTSTTH